REAGIAEAAMIAVAAFKTAGKRSGHQRVPCRRRIGLILPRLAARCAACGTRVRAFFSGQKNNCYVITFSDCWRHPYGPPRPRFASPPARRPLPFLADVAVGRAPPAAGARPAGRAVAGGGLGRGMVGLMARLQLVDLHLARGGQTVLEQLSGSFQDGAI